MLDVPGLVDRLNFLLPFGRWQLFEISDLWIIPTVIKNQCQNTLTAQWTRRLPLLQRQSPAELAANAMLEALQRIPDIDSSQWTVIDFCSGGGGPVPVIESLVNYGRRMESKRPIPFKLSDLVPNIDAWVEASSRSDHLSFVPQPVDAAFPPFSVISSTTPGDRKAAKEKGFVSNGSKIFRTFFLSFHHFDDDIAKKVLQSTLQTSDAFAIVELQDRRILTLAFILKELWLLFLIGGLWFWNDTLQLMLIYAVPVLPVIHCFDGIVSCLRTRTSSEIMDLVNAVGGGEVDMTVPEGSGTKIRRGQWKFTHTRALHTWPVCHMEVTIGLKEGA